MFSDGQCCDEPTSDSGGVWFYALSGPRLFSPGGPSSSVCDGQEEGQIQKKHQDIQSPGMALAY